MQLSKNEEDYLKAMFHLTFEDDYKKVGTNQLAQHLGLSPASVNNMLKKLKTKKLVNYEKYGKLELTFEGKSIAIQLIRKHRLWESFLYERLDFTWDEVHDVAEQLEHIQSEKLIEQLDKFLGRPKVDPHGDFIPDTNGKFKKIKKKTLSQIPIGETCKLVSVKDNSVQFLQYITKIGLELSNDINVIDRQEFDESSVIEFNGKQINVSRKFCENVFVI